MLTGAYARLDTPVVIGKSGKKRAREVDTPPAGPARLGGGEQQGGRGLDGIAPAGPRAPAGGEGAATLGKSAKKRARGEARREAALEPAAEARREGDGHHPADTKAPDGGEAAAPLSKSAKKRARQAARAEATGNGPTSAPVLSVSKMEAAGQGPTVAAVPSVSKMEKDDAGPDANPKKKKKQKRVPDGSVADSQGPGAEGDRREDAAGRGDLPCVAGVMAENGNGARQTPKGQDLRDAMSDAGAGGVHPPGSGGHALGKKLKKDRGEGGSVAGTAVPLGDRQAAGEGAPKGKKRKDRDAFSGPAKGDTPNVSSGGGSEVGPPQGARVASGDVPGDGGTGRKEKKRKKASAEESEGAGGRTAGLSQVAVKQNAGQKPAVGGGLQNGMVDLGTKKKVKKRKDRAE
jgi:hypothetical protein